jgi:hypothetical protein
VISRHVALQAELVEKRLLHHRPFAHHQLNLPLRKTESGLYTASNAAFFNDIRHFATFMALIQSGPSRYGLKRAIVDIRWGMVEFTPMTPSESSLALGWTHTHGP